MDFMTTFSAARRVSTPLLAIQTADPANTMSAILVHGTKFSDGTVSPVLAWDIVRGFWAFPENKPGQQALAAITSSRGAESYLNPVEALQVAAKLPSDSILFFLNGHKFFQDPAVIQAIWNLRDVFKSERQALVILSPAVQLPPEIAQDVLILSEPLPTVQELEAKVAQIYKAGGLAVPSPEVVAQATDATCGLAAFPAEQVLAMSLSRAGLDIPSLWDRKRTQIEQTPGLSVWKGTENFADVIDCDNVISFLKAYAHNIGGIVFIDEIEKVMAGASGDTSGVSQKMHGTLLSWMQDSKAKGILLIGHPGTGKSMLAKCTGTLSGKPVIKFDMAAMENSLVGASNANLSAALQVVNAVCNGRPLVIATCNKIESLSPELRRRFKRGTFFFDLPSKTGRIALWKLYSKRFDVSLPSPLGFDDSNWTGAEIETCCELAQELGVTLAQASGYIVPIAKSAFESIETLRKQAAGRFISASKPGTYDPQDQTLPASNVSRRLDLN